MAPILDIRGLKKSFRTGMFHKGRAITALAGVDLTIESGDTLGLVGESGCGKTTLARCVLRLIAPDDGSVFFDGCDLLRLSPAELLDPAPRVSVDLSRCLRLSGSPHDRA